MNARKKLLKSLKRYKLQVNDQHTKSQSTDALRRYFNDACNAQI